MDSLVRQLLQANLESLDRAIADGKLIRVLLQYEALVHFVLKYEIEEDSPYEALNRAFVWLQNRIGFSVAAQPGANLPNPKDDYGNN